MKLLLKKMFRMLAGFSILLVLQICSERFLHFLGVKFPATIFGMIIFVLLLPFKIIPARLVKDICGFMISILPSLFVPLLVGITVYYNSIKQNFLGIAAVIVIGTFVTMVSTAIFVDKMMEWTGKKDAS